MADTPDDLLAKARAGMGEWLDAEDRSDAEFEAAQRMYQGIHDLDRLLSSGAPLPSAWTRRKGTLTASVHLSDRASISGTGTLVFAKPGETAELRYDSGAEWPALASRQQGENADAVAVEAVRHPNAVDAEIGVLRGRLAERDARIARLTAELDSLRGTPVEYVTSGAALAAAMTADPGREDGSVLRETYGQRRAWAWKAAAREWEQVP